MTRISWDYVLLRILPGRVSTGSLCFVSAGPRPLFPSDFSQPATGTGLTSLALRSTKECTLERDS